MLTDSFTPPLVENISLQIIQYLEWPRNHDIYLFVYVHIQFQFCIATAYLEYDKAVSFFLFSKSSIYLPLHIIRMDFSLQCMRYILESVLNLEKGEPGNEKVGISLADDVLI